MADIPVGAFLVARPQPTIESTWSASVGQFIGTTHSHTTESDGTLTPTELSTAYLARGHSWLAITDHGSVTEDPEVAGMTHIAGEELATGVSWPEHPHVVGLGLSETIEDVDDAQTNVNAVLAAGGIAVLAHPLDDSYHQAITGYTHLELNWNTGYSGQALLLWDRKLTEGERIFAVLADDTHYPYLDGTTALTMDSRGMTVVNAPSSSAADVLAAIRAGNCYATSSRDNMTRPSCLITSIAVADGIVTVDLPQESNIYWYMQNGTLIRSAFGVTSDKLWVHGHELYVRIKVVPTADTTRWAYSQPIWVTP